jgi:hypothetical protein
MPVRPRGGVVTQRSAKPFTPVQFRAWPPAVSKIGPSHVNIKSTELAAGERFADRCLGPPGAKNAQAAAPRRLARHPFSAPEIDPMSQRRSLCPANPSGPHLTSLTRIPGTLAPER